MQQVEPWNHWYHCMGNTYGTWLPGDDRGFRTYQSKLRVPYDYRHRPRRGTYQDVQRRSTELMKREPVFLKTAGQRRRALAEIVTSLQKRDIEIVVVSVDRVHFHVLGRFPAHDPRRWIGLAKKESSHYCKESGHAAAGGIWAASCECKPVRDAAHHGRVVDYIADHAKRGAALWRDPQPYRADEPPPLADFNPADLLID